MSTTKARKLEVLVGKSVLFPLNAHFLTRPLTLVGQLSDPWRRGYFFQCAEEARQLSQRASNSRRKVGFKNHGKTNEMQISLKFQICNYIVERNKDRCFHIGWIK
jgi:hypothetical protein